MFYLTRHQGKADENLTGYSSALSEWLHSKGQRIARAGEDMKKGTTQAQLVRIEISAATVENSVEIKHLSQTYHTTQQAHFRVYARKTPTQ